MSMAATRTCAGKSSSSARGSATGIGAQLWPDSPDIVPPGVGPSASGSSFARLAESGAERELHVDQMLLGSRELEKCRRRANAPAGSFLALTLFSFHSGCSFAGLIGSVVAAAAMAPVARDDCPAAAACRLTSPCLGPAGPRVIGRYVGRVSRHCRCCDPFALRCQFLDTY
jgi:hypothetical protein